MVDAITLKKRNISREFHYIELEEKNWERHICKRNKEIQKKMKMAYFVDEGVKAKCNTHFEMPTKEKIDVWIKEE